ncbi:MAG: antibiotic biosynthesis monooxygenase [Deltaproteobacteria bacterium]|nr:antibiotic biosynthesis monooxygenase [Deltaproteobacteria bacterium]
MVDVAIRITVPLIKRKEVFQTFTSILSQIRREKGCLSCNCYVDMEAENKIYFKEEWQTSDDLNSHLRSVHFGVLIGAMKMLDQEPEIRFNTISSTAGAEVVKAVRA